MAPDKRAILAANNNADLYEAMFAAWGVGYDRRSYAFVGTDRPPPFYSNLVVLAPDCLDQISAELHALARSFEGAIGLKDSFCEFGLQTESFELLFGASWIWRPAEAARLPDGWMKVASSGELEHWEAAWKRCGSLMDEEMFRSTMLQDSKIAFLGKADGNDFVAGCIANLSPECVGISNVFSVLSNDDAFREATAAVASFNHHRPIVGYEAEPRLRAARQAGFETTGSLRILVVSDAHFGR